MNSSNLSQSLLIETYATLLDIFGVIYNVDKKLKLKV